MMERIPLPHTFLPPIELADRRVYDLLDFGIYEHEGHDFRWTLESMAQDRACQNTFFFKILLFPGTFASPPIHSSQCKQCAQCNECRQHWATIARAGRGAILAYLKHHPQPQRIYPTGGPILLAFD